MDLLAGFVDRSDPITGTRIRLGCVPSWLAGWRSPRIRFLSPPARRRLLRCFLAFRRAPRSGRRQQHQRSRWFRCTHIRLERRWSVSNGRGATSPLRDSLARRSILILPSSCPRTTQPGAAIRRDQLAAVASAVPLLVLDAAYEEFATETLTETAWNWETSSFCSHTVQGLGFGPGFGWDTPSGPGLRSTTSRFGTPYPVSGRICGRRGPRLVTAG